MFEKFKKDRQQVDIVNTKSGVYLTANFKDEEGEFKLYNEPFRIKKESGLVEIVAKIAKKNPKYLLNCKFDSPFKTTIIGKSTFKDYIIKLNELVNDEFEYYKKNTQKKERIDTNKNIKTKIKDWYYTQTFQRLLKRITKKSLDTEIFPSEILLNEGGKHLSVIGPGMDDFCGYGSARVDLYELTKIMPRKKIFTMSTYMAKKINSGVISRISSDFEMSPKKRLKEMEKEGRYVKVRGFPAVITFDSEIDSRDPILRDINKFYIRKK